MKGFGIGLILSSFFRGVLKLFNAIITLIAYILIYFGLWIPCIYMIFIVILMLTVDLNLSVMNTNTILVYIGLLIALAGSVIITARNLIVKPITEINGRNKAHKEAERRATIDRAKKLQARNPDKYYRRYGAVPPQDIPDLPLFPRKVAEKPLVYRSNRNEEIVIHEFRDRYEVFRDNEGRLTYIETKRKN